MPNWTNSNRRSRLPSDWPKRRARALRRDGKLCQWRLDGGERCLQPATDVDHIRPGDDHSDDNLQSLCGEHHSLKSSQEGAAALAAKRRKINQKFRWTETHPGLL